MINISFNIRNPFSQRFKNLGCVTFATPFKNKFFELEVYRDTSILSFNFSWTIRQSHAGLDIELGLLNHCVHANFYDNRHWNYEKDRWYKNGETDDWID